MVLVAGLPSPAAFGEVTVLAHQVVPLSGVTIPTVGVFPTGYVQTITRTATPTSGQTPTGGKRVGVFGPVTPTTVFPITLPVAGVGSAQNFGAVTAARVTAAPGLGSAQTFGAVQVHAEIAIAVSGIASAQQFGVIYGRVRNVWIWPTTYFPSTGGVICGFVICGDGHTVGGWDYLPAAGRVDTVELEPHEVSTLDLEPTLVK